MRFFEDGTNVERLLDMILTWALIIGGFIFIGLRNF